ncbi:MAG: M56 family metallopeptidase [Bacteroidales bacterium]|nr:M56 family metallopeptidase [Bacteroidales bacterium]
MENLILYLLQSAGTLSLFYLLYHVAFRGETHFRLNRFYFLLAGLASLLLPLAKANIFGTASMPANTMIFLDTVLINGSDVQQIAHQHVGIFQIITGIYLFGVVFLLLRFVIKMVQLFGLIHSSEVTRYGSWNLVVMEEGQAPFSFFNYLFINRSQMEPAQIETIAAHEQVHWRQLHSADLLLAELLTIFQWFNPFVWLYRRALETVHEYLADEGVLRKGYEPFNYQNLLLVQATGVSAFGFANHFNHSLIKKRIIMMTKNKSRRWSQLKVLLALPLTLLLIAAFTFSLPAGELMQKVSSSAVVSSQPVSTLTDAVPDTLRQERIVYSVVDQMPEFPKVSGAPGGISGLMGYLQENIIYPEEARNAGLQGSVYVTFVVEADGRITNVQVIRGVGEPLDKVAEDVIAGMPVWEPGKKDGEAVAVQFTMPIKFTLDGDKDQKKENAEPEK